MYRSSLLSRPSCPSYRLDPPFRIHLHRRNGSQALMGPYILSLCIHGGNVHYPLLTHTYVHTYILIGNTQLPTFVLSFTILNPRFRSNVLFAISFFLTRIVLHIILCISYLLPQNRAHATGGSFLPSTVLTVVFPLHAMWFHGCIQGFIKRAQNATSTNPPPFIELDPLPADT